MDKGWFVAFAFWMVALREMSLSAVLTSLSSLISFSWNSLLPFIFLSMIPARHLSTSALKEVQRQIKTGTTFQPRNSHKKAVMGHGVCIATLMPMQ